MSFEDIRRLIDSVLDSETRSTFEEKRDADCAYQIPSIMQTSKKLGMVTMNDSLFSLVKQGQVEPKEAWMKSVDKTGLLGLFRSNGIAVDFAST